MAEPALAVRDLDVALERNGHIGHVLDGIDFDIAAGEIVALVGASGSGKSTLGATIQGLLPGDARPTVTGSIRLAGVEVVGASEHELQRLRRSLVRLVPQDPLNGLDPSMTVARQMVPAPHRAAAVDWLRRTGIADPERVARSYPHRLSGGQRQRVLIAMAMMAHPRLLITDEPTTALDVTTQAQVLDVLRRLVREQGTAVLFITHDLAVAASLADRIVVLEAGRIVEAGALETVLNAPTAPGTRRLLAARYDLRSDRSRALPTDHAGEVWSPPRIEATNALELAGVSKSFERSQVLRSVDLAIRTGESVALVGESGAGKSTLLRIAAGLLSPDSGAVSRLDARPQIVYQDPVAALTPWLSIGEQVADRLRSSGIGNADRQQRLTEAFDMVGLPASLIRALPGELSVGQCQRAVLARAIVVPPRLLLCDEPVSAMDMPLAATMLNLLGELRRRLGMALLFVTHDLAAARIVGDRIAVLRHGVLVETGDAESIIAAPTTEYGRALVAAVPSLVPTR